MVGQLVRLAFERIVNWPNGELGLDPPRQGAMRKMESGSGMAVRPSGEGGDVAETAAKASPTGPALGRCDARRSTAGRPAGGRFACSSLDGAFA